MIQFADLTACILRRYSERGHRPFATKRSGPDSQQLFTCGVCRLRGWWQLLASGPDQAIDALANIGVGSESLSMVHDLAPTRLTGAIAGVARDFAAASNLT
jgi:hypothetical protein